MPQQGYGPLQGLKVFDIGTTIAGPLASTLMADFGADVVKIEHPRLGDAMRHWWPLKNDVSLWWKVIGRNKRLITLDFSKPAGRDLFLKMIADADIIIENFRPGTLERWGLGYDRLSAVNPGLILVRISGYGQDGPYSHRPGYGTIAEAMTGVPSFTGFPDAPPTLAGYPQADCVAALFACFSAMFAVYHRDVRGTGEGQVIDVSLFEPLFRIVESQVILYDQLQIMKERLGNRMQEEAPRNAYATKDGEWVTISASTNKTFERLAAAIGRPDLPANPKFATNDSRVAHAGELDAIIAGWFAEHTLDEAMRVLEAHDVVAGPVYNIERIFRDPQYRAREAIITVDDPDFGPVKMQNVVPKFSKTPGRVRHAGLAMGTHNEEFYLGELKLERAHYEHLKQQGVI